ncbi:MAG: magnesium transporter [Candidatus Desulfofervidaceae bacterium]|nr:magnesium transporter [Candidatus Desulfofervidaceae bacterium]
MDYKILKKQVKELLSKKREKSILELLSTLHPADIAELINNLHDAEDKKRIFSLLDVETASEVIVELSDESRRAILKDITHDRLADIVEDLPSDEATDIIADLPKEKAEEVLANISPEDSAEVRHLLKYPEESAGGLMQTEVLALSADITVEEAIERLRILAHETEEEYHNIFIINGNKKLVGVVPINKLILSPPHSRLSQLMEKPEAITYVDEDQEEVARKFQKYDLVTAPVVDRDGVLLGRITIDDIVDVIEEEVSEDLFRMAGIEEAEKVVYTDRVFKIAQMRLPWIVVNILGELVTGYLLWLFKHTLADAIILVSFIPVINATAGNAGLQSSSIMVRGWATGRINFSNFKQQIFKELKVALLMATICGMVGGMAAYMWHGHKVLGLIIGVSMFFTINLAVFWGTLFPSILRKMGLDPAVASGPFVATLNDIMGVIVYMSIATVFLHHLV